MSLPPIDIEITSILTDVENVANVDNIRNVSKGIFTIWPDTIDDRYLTPEYYNLEDKVMNWCGQFEKCPTTGRLHAHIYFEFKNNKRTRFSLIKKKFDEVSMSFDFKASRKRSTKQRQCAVNYCVDVVKRAPDTDAFFWSKNAVFLTYKEEVAINPEKKLSRKETQRLHIESKPIEWNWASILHEDDTSKELLFDCTWGPKYHKSRFVEIETRDIENVVIYYGAGGTGKTTMAKEISDNYYRRNFEDGVFWGGGGTAYNNESLIHLEEFNGQETFSKLKELCDVGAQGPPVNVKNGGITLNHDTVVFTSNHHPAYWYQTLWKKHDFEFLPFWRRVTKVVFFPEKREDGDRNAPDDDHKPYFVDQTEDWKSFQGDYTKCLSHAEKHWKQTTDSESIVSLNYDPMYQYCRTGKISRPVGR